MILECCLLSIQPNKKLVKTSNCGQFSYTKLHNSEKNVEKEFPFINSFHFADIFHNLKQRYTNVNIKPRRRKNHFK